MSRPAPNLDNLPLFAPDEVLSAVVMGPGKSREWTEIATLLERKGLPKIDALMGGRYVPAVKAFFDKDYGLHQAPTLQSPDGVERLGTWKKSKHPA